MQKKEKPSHENQRRTQFFCLPPERKYGIFMVSHFAKNAESGSF